MKCSRCGSTDGLKISYKGKDHNIYKCEKCRQAIRKEYLTSKNRYSVMFGYNEDVSPEWLEKARLSKERILAKY